MALISDRDKELLSDEQFDPRKLMLCCHQHFYFGPSPNTKVSPVHGCKECWMVYFLHDLCTVPPSQRAQRMEEMVEVVRNLNQMYESGQWDFKPYAAPKVEIEKDGLPD